MMKLLTVPTIALVLASTSVAQAAEVSRESAPVEAASEIGGGSSLIYILIAVLLSGVVSIGDIFGGDEDDPDSP